MLLEFVKSQAFGGIICIIIGFIFIWSIIKFITKDIFLNSDKFEAFKTFTPLPPIFNYYLIKTILSLGAIISIGGGIFGIIKHFLNI